MSNVPRETYLNAESFYNIKYKIKDQQRLCFLCTAQIILVVAILQ